MSGDEGECCDNADFLDGAEDDDLDGGGGDVMMEDDDTKSNTSSTFSTGTGFVNKKVKKITSDNVPPLAAPSLEVTMIEA